MNPIAPRWPLVDVETEQSVVGDLLLFRWPEVRHRVNEVRDEWFGDPLHAALVSWARRRAAEDVNWPEESLRAVARDVGRRANGCHLMALLAKCALAGMPSEWNWRLGLLRDRWVARCRLAKAERSWRQAALEADVWWERMRCPR